jgi:hypothetical protein
MEESHCRQLGPLAADGYGTASINQLTSRRRHRRQTCNLTTNVGLEC